MSRIRTIKPEFWVSEQIVECSTNARLMFIGMWNFCDDGGNHPASLKSLKMQIFPGDGFSVDEIAEWVEELKDQGLIVEYQGIDEKKYWHVTGWHHQKIDRPSFKYPEFDERSSNDRGAPPPGRERKGKERKGRDGSVDVVADATQPAEKETPVQKPKKEKSPQNSAAPPCGIEIPEPLQTEKFRAAFDGLLKMPKWRKKPQGAVLLALKNLARYHPDFSAALVESAIMGNYQGVVFPDTDQKYSDWQRQKNSAPNHNGQNGRATLNHFGENPDDYITPQQL